MTMTTHCQVCSTQVASLTVPFHDTELLVCYACADDILHKLAPAYNSSIIYSLEDIQRAKEAVRAA